MDQQKRNGVKTQDDYRVELAKIPDVKEEWETEHQIRALVVNDRSLALDFLLRLKRDPRDYGKIIKVARLVAGQRRVRNENHVKRGKKTRDVYEMRAHKGRSRLFFFYAQDGSVVCTHGFCKAKASEAEQDREFERCEKLKQLWDTHSTAT